MPADQAAIIGLSGKTGSGKTTLASALSQHLGGSIAAFGEYVRQLAMDAGKPITRSSLQDIGCTAVQSDPVFFVDGFLEWARPAPNLPLIIDGIRHASVDAQLRLWASRHKKPYRAIMVSASDNIRAARRTAGDMVALARLDSHLVEQEFANGVPGFIDLVVDGGFDVGEAVRDVMTLVSSIR